MVLIESPLPLGIDVTSESLVPGIGSSTFYRYVQNDPVNQTDPSGLGVGELVMDLITEGGQLTLFEEFYNNDNVIAIAYRDSAGSNAKELFNLAFATCGFELNLVGRFSGTSINPQTKRVLVGTDGTANDIGHRIYSVVRQILLNYCPGAGRDQALVLGLYQSLEDLLAAMCLSCANPQCTPAQCKAEARKIALALEYTFSKNYSYPNAFQTSVNNIIGVGGINPIVGGEGLYKRDDRVGGFLCDEWANSFLDAFNTVGSKCFTGSLGISIKDVNVTGAGGRLHAWLTIKAACDPTKVIYIDDGFNGDGLIHFKPPLPPNYVELTSPKEIKPYRDCPTAPPACNFEGRSWGP